MEMLGNVLCIVGIVITAIALIWSFVLVIQENTVLGILCLFLPMGLPVVLLLWWPRTWKQLAAWAIGLTIFFCGLALRSPGGEG